MAEGDAILQSANHSVGAWKSGRGQVPTVGRRRGRRVGVQARARNRNSVRNRVGQANGIGYVYKQR